MRILTRYILREVTSHALIGVAIFTFVIYTKELGQILELVVRNSAPLPSAIELFLLIIPEALTITIPAGVLIGILIGLSRLAADSEITAMKASGMGIGSFLSILSIFFLAAWLLALGNSLYLAPRSQPSGRAFFLPTQAIHPRPRSRWRKKGFWSVKERTRCIFT